jgi:hypothetical protein
VRINEIITESKLTKIDETSEESQELAEFSQLASNYMYQVWEEYYSNPENAQNVNKIKNDLDQGITPAEHPNATGSYTTLMPTIYLANIPQTEKFNSTGLQLIKKFIGLTVAAFKASATDAEADVHGFSDAPGGLYDNSSRLIPINVDYLKDRKWVAQTISHEAQHAIDDFKSRKGVTPNTDHMDLDIYHNNTGKALNYKYPSNKNPTAPEKFQNYLTQTTEINARFSEVIKDIKDRVETDDITHIQGGNLLVLINDAFQSHWMPQAFPKGINDPRYKRLVNRTYVWLSKYYANRFAPAGSITGNANVQQI